MPTKRIRRVRRPALMRVCADREGLSAWLLEHLQVRVGTQAVCAGHDAPLDYLWAAYQEPARDLVVWAPRGGGKTRLAAAASLLDLLHKPGCRVRIIGGSLQQSLRMWEHLCPDLEDVAAKLIDGKVRARHVNLSNGSGAAVLTQSQRAVRGLHIQKFRCDEVELFQPEVWEALQLATRSCRRGDARIAGTVEAISTMHVPGGLMQRIVERASADGVRVLRWCILEVLERCPPERECAACPLWEDCKGIARTRCDGHFAIDDAIAMKRRVSKQTWEAEMLCRRPMARNAVFPDFKHEVHVREVVARHDGQEVLWLAIDFGFNNPFVCLWVRHGGGVVHVIDEYVQEHRTVAQHIPAIRARGHGPLRLVACDPAGNGRNDQTAQSNVTLLRREGFEVHCRGSFIADGIEAIRAGLAPAAGEPTLFVHPRCRRLITALSAYRYPEGGGEQPIKDGTHDHPIDALRYFYANASAGAPAKTRTY